MWLAAGFVSIWTDLVLLLITVKKVSRTHPSYLSRSTSAVKWSLAWLALSVTMETSRNGQHQRNFKRSEHTEIVSTGKTNRVVAGREMTIPRKHSQRWISRRNKQKKKKAQRHKTASFSYSTLAQKMSLGLVEEKEKPPPKNQHKSVYLAYNINTFTIYHRCRKPRLNAFHSDRPSILQTIQYVAVANTYWIIDVFGFQSISTIAAFIKVLAWLMVLRAKSYPCMPLQGLHWR